MPKEIPKNLTEQLAYMNARDMVDRIDKRKMGKESFHGTFDRIHAELYEGTRNASPDDRLEVLQGKRTGLAGDNAFSNLRDKLTYANGEKREDAEMDEVLARFYQRALHPDVLPYGSETSLTVQVFTYFIAHSYGHDLDYRRAEDADIAVLRDPNAHSLEEVREVFAHMLDKERSPVMLHDGEEVPNEWKMPPQLHDPRLPEDPREEFRRPAGKPGYDTGGPYIRRNAPDDADVSRRGVRGEIRHRRTRGHAGGIQKG
jgi:hypothetical protein